MNPVFREASRLVDGGWIMGVMTVLFFACFVGWSWWAYARHNREMFEAAAMLPITTGDEE
jgi:cbb3-type cytochrome oxidase subunit 3